MMKEVLEKLANGLDLPAAAAETAMHAMMDGSATPAQIAAYLTLLRQKGETVEELTGSARAMRDRALQFDVDGDGLIDTCGTGGDHSGTFNISTTAAIVAAAAGARVAKHGNRAASSKTGSADVLQALGVAIDMRPRAAARCLQEAGICFLFAQAYHPAMKHVAPIRRELGFRTMFNILGPLTNPARPLRQVLGTPSDEIAEKMARVLAALGSEHTLVVHAHAGLDEIALTGATRVFEVRTGGVVDYTINAATFGLSPCELDAVAGGEPEENASIVRSVLGGESGARRDIVVANAGASLYVAGLAQSLYEGARLAERTIDAGKATATLEQLIALSNQGVEEIGA